MTTVVDGDDCGLGAHPWRACRLHRCQEAAARIFIAIGVTACGAMVFIGEGNVGLASTLFFIANLGVSGSTGVLRLAAAPRGKSGRHRPRVVGRLRHGLHRRRSAAVDQPGLDSPAGDVWLQRTVPAIKASFVSVAVWWAVFSLPIFRKVPEPPATSVPESGVAIVAAFTRLAATFKEVRKYRNAFLLFIAMLLYQDGIQTIIRMSGVYGAEVGVDQTSQIAAFVMVQFLAIPFSFLFGSLGVRIGTKRAIFIAITVYVLATILAYFMTSVTHFFILAAMIATVQGGAQALSRALFSRMVPADRTSEFFGFFAVSERFATVLGPLVFTISVTLTGNSHAAIIAISASSLPAPGS